MQSAIQKRISLIRFPYLVVIILISFSWSHILTERPSSNKNELLHQISSSSKVSIDSRFGESHSTNVQVNLVNDREEYERVFKTLLVFIPFVR